MACSAVLLSACATVTDREDPASGHWPSVNVFAVAHQDDWQLFMNPKAFHSMDEPGEKAVFIHVTAGDAGLGASGEPIPYYLAREEGALRAVRFMANAKPDAGLGFEMERAIVERGGKTIQRMAYANAVLYFLRLPDGNLEGPGYETTGWQSLERLRTGAIAEVKAVDGSARYEGWNDLTGALSEIVRSEMRVGEALGLHISEQDMTLNPGDHSDHRNTALAVEAVALRFPCASVYRYDTYITRHRDVNVAGDDLLVNVGTWAATSSGLSDSYASSTWDPLHNSWVGRAYSRVVTPDASCTTSPVTAR
jgi:hypothetical protein